MRIHHKLLTLLLVFSVVPLLLSIAISHIFFYRAGMHLAKEAERQLSDQAHLTLQKMVNGFQQLQERDRRVMEAALTLQSGQVLSSTSGSSPAGPSVPLAYRVVMSYRPGTVSRQMTVYTSGASGCYPANDKCLDAESLKQGSWYRTTARKQVLTRTLAADPVRGEQAVIVASPLRDEAGRFLGVTALVRPVSAMFTDLRLSEDWFGTARELLVAIEPGSDIARSKLRILAMRKAGPEALFPQNLLQPDSATEKQRLMTRLVRGTGGSLELKLAGVETHWIFAAATRGEPFALILVPHSQVIAQAVAAREHVVQKTLKGLGISVVLLLGAVGAVFICAILAAKKVTRPLSQLVVAAARLVGGDYSFRVKIETGDEVAELGEVFNQLGPALAERERMASALALAGDVQRHLLPLSQPQLAGFDIFGGALPCDETGGDYYDFIPLEGARLALAVGDVSGHGVGAALLMSGARGVLRSHASRYGLRLAALFATLNEHLCRDTADEKFMTLFYGVLVSEERTLYWGSAGHGPHFYYRAQQRTVLELGSTGLPLGVLDDMEWEQGPSLVFARGDILLIGTDGIWEAQNAAGELLGTEPIKELILSCADQPAAQIHAAVMERVRNFSLEYRQEDDITLIVIKSV